MNKINKGGGNIKVLQMVEYIPNKDYFIIQDLDKNDLFFGNWLDYMKKSKKLRELFQSDIYSLTTKENYICILIDNKNDE